MSAAASAAPGLRRLVESAAAPRRAPSPRRRPPSAAGRPGCRDWPAHVSAWRRRGRAPPGQGRGRPRPARAARGASRRGRRAPAKPGDIERLAAGGRRERRRQCHGATRDASSSTATTSDTGQRRRPAPRPRTGERCRHLGVAVDGARLQHHVGRSEARARSRNACSSGDNSKVMTRIDRRKIGRSAPRYAAAPRAARARCRRPT